MATLRSATPIVVALFAHAATPVEARATEAPPAASAAGEGAGALDLPPPPTPEPAETTPPAQEPREARPQSDEPPPTATAPVEAPSTEGAAPVDEGARFRAWDDHEDMTWMMGMGAIEVCDALAFPVRFIPYVGEVGSIVLEWACIIPGAFNVDFVSLYHGEQDGQVWQAGVALVLAKLWRDLTRWPVVIGVTVVGLALASAITAYSLTGVFVDLPVEVDPSVLPVAFTGILVGSGVTYILVRKLRKEGQELIFETLYPVLTPELDDARRKEAQAQSWVKPPLNGFERLWILASMAGGSDPDGSWIHLVPIVGRIVKAGRANEALKADIRRVGKDVLDENPGNLAAMDMTIDVVGYAEGGLAAAADAGLVIGGVLFLAGSTFAALQYANQQNVAEWVAITAGFGTLGVVVGSAALLCVAAREIPKLVRPFAVPLAYGFMPPDGWSGFYRDEMNFIDGYPEGEAPKPVDDGATKPDAGGSQKPVDANSE